ncbi:MAG: C1 family peptidase [Micropruina sp.]
MWVCVSFAVTALVESMVLVEHGTEADLSEADLFFCGGGSCKDGWSPGDAISRIRSAIGIPSESVFRYPNPAMQSPCHIGGGRTLLTVRARHDVAFFNAKSRKNYLSSVGPMVACMDVYEDSNCYADGVYEHVVGERVGGHCVLMVGYDDIQQCWIGKNSWGPSWGKQGFFRIRYG